MTNKQTNEQDKQFTAEKLARLKQESMQVRKANQEADFTHNNEG